MLLVFYHFIKSQLFIITVQIQWKKMEIAFTIKNGYHEWKKNKFALKICVSQERSYKFVIFSLCHP